VGCLCKRVVYKGCSAHAGSSPWNGINALYAAQQGLGAVNAIRETFQEKDYIRVHPIITAGGSAVNAIPETVVLESYVRSSNFEAMTEASAKVNRALTGAALSLGANVDIQDTPGYAPLQISHLLLDVAEEAAAAIDMPFIRHNDISTGSTDMGDISQIMPAIHPYAAGASGTGHGSDYRIADGDAACLTSAKWQLAMLQMLLRNDAQRAREILANFTPAFPSARDYLNYIDAIACRGDRIRYTDSGAEVTL
jgi:metal-dependent amidase/aminoacylase/carboxypeptidase family protein